MGIKYNDNGTIKDIKVKVGDNIPVGAEMDYDGTTIPVGWQEVVDNYDMADYIDDTVITMYEDGTSIKKDGNIVNISMNFEISNYSANTNYTIANLPTALRPDRNIVGGSIFHNASNNISAGRFFVFSNGNIVVRCSSNSVYQCMFNITYIIS